MKDFINKIIGDKKEYKDMMKRVDNLPEEYSYTFKKIQSYMWNYATGDGFDILRVQYDLIDLFEEAAADNRQVLEVTGEDVAGFCDELLSNAKTYTSKLKTKLNEDITKHVKK